MLLAVSTAGAAPPDAFEPFDLTYLPRGGSGTTVFPLTTGESRRSAIPVLIAVRPAALFKHPAARKHTEFVNELAAAFLASLGYRGDGPGIENTESILVRGSFALQENPEERGRFETSCAASGGVLRTVRPFDWPTLIRRSFPDAVEVDYRGARFLAFMPKNVRLPQPSSPEAERSLFAMYCPDSRTLVFESETHIRQVIDRVKDGKLEAPQPGWGQVERSSVAIALDLRNKEWLHVFPRTPGPHIPIERSAFLQNIDDIVLGLETGPSTRFHLLWSSRNQLVARQARESSLRTILFNLLPTIGNGPDPKRTISPAREAAWNLIGNLLWGNTTQKALGSEYVGTVPDDLLYFLFRMVDGDPAIEKQALLLRGNLAGSKKQFDRVIVLMNELIRIDPKNSKAWGMRGVAYCAKGSIERGLADFEASIRLNPNDANILFTRAGVLCRKREYEKAMPDLDAVLRINPRKVDAFIYRSNLWKIKGEFDKAEKDLSEAITCDPSSKSAFWYRAEIYSQQRSWKKAIDDLTAALRLSSSHDPKLIQLYMTRAGCKHLVGDIDGAIADYTEVVRIDAKSPLGFDSRGYEWRAKGEYQKALDDFDRALQRKPNDQYAIITQADIRASCPDAKLRDGVRAIAGAELVCFIMNSQAKPHQLAVLAAAYAENRQFDKAVKHQREVLKTWDTEENRKRLKLYEEGFPCHTLIP